MIKVVNQIKSYPMITQLVMQTLSLAYAFTVPALSPGTSN